MVFPVIKDLLMGIFAWGAAGINLVTKNVFLFFEKEEETVPNYLPLGNDVDTNITVIFHRLLYDRRLAVERR